MRRPYGLIIGMLLVLAPTMALGDFITVTPGENVFTVLLWWGGGAETVSKSSTTIIPYWLGGKPPVVSFTVVEPSKAILSGYWKWEYVTGPLHVGDIFVAQGDEFQLMSIDTKGYRFDSHGHWVADAPCKYDICSPYAIIKRLPVVVSRYGRKALVLSKLMPNATNPADEYSVRIPTKKPQSGVTPGCYLIMRLSSTLERNGRYVAWVSTRTQLARLLSSHCVARSVPEHG